MSRLSLNDNYKSMFSFNARNFDVEVFDEEFDAGKRCGPIIRSILELSEKGEISKADSTYLLWFIVSVIVGSKLSNTISSYVENDLDNAIKYYLKKAEMNR